jgi:hypothetical protein
VSTTEIINLIAAIIVSPVIYLLLAQLIKRPEWHPLAKAALAIALSGIVAIAQSWITGDLGALIDDWGSLTAAQVLGYWAVIYAAGQLTYNAIGGREFMIKLAQWPERGG